MNGFTKDLSQRSEGERGREGERESARAVKERGGSPCTDVHRLHAPAPSFPLTRLGYGSSSGESRACEDG